LVEVELQEGDDHAFVEIVRATANAVATRYSPTELITIKVDNWFGPRWFHFSGKTLGALGVHRKTLTVPPFVPARILWQHSYRSPSFEIGISRSPLHIAIWSENALGRRFAEVAPETAVVWFSGNSSKNGRGAIMVYIHVKGECSGWYSGWVRNDVWQSEQLKGISRNELHSLLLLSDFQVAAQPAAGADR